MKVDEQFKCKDCDNYNQCKYYHNRRETSFICKEFQNQWGFIKELEKIKADFEEIQLLRDNPYNNRTEYSVSMKELRELFDEHISKLKGEQE